MALSRDEFTAEQLRDVEECEASADALRRHMKDREFMKRVLARAEELDKESTGSWMTSEQFLEQTAIPEE